LSRVAPDSAEPQAWGVGLMNTTIFVGLNVHKATVSVAVAEGLRGGEVRCLGTFPNRADQIAKFVQRLAREGRWPLRVSNMPALWSRLRSSATRRCWPNCIEPAN
ncbi:MAG: hypothetical protein WB610_16360, partial [Rhodomicrobium sp.]